jgi:DNA-binding response OmpR family regulator
MKAMQMGVDDCLVQPVEIEDLEGRIEAALQRP